MCPLSQPIIRLISGWVGSKQASDTAPPETPMAKMPDAYMYQQACFQTSGIHISST